MTSKNGEEDKAPMEPGMYTMVEGVNIPSVFAKACGRPLEEHVALLKAMDMRPDDVIVAAFGKAGTHWIWEVTSMILAKSAEYEKRTKEFAMMEATAIEELESQTSPRVLNSHLPLRLLPAQIKEKKVKVIHVYRNCKDILVSLYFHVRQVRSAVTFEAVEKMMIGPGVPGGDYFAYMQLMDQYKKDNPDAPLFTISYEDNKEDPEKSIGKLAKFLGVELSPQLITDIAEATSITKMREVDKQKQQRDLDKMPYIQMYRKGQVGDWKNYLTVAQSERLDAAMTQLQSCDYNFRYTL